MQDRIHLDHITIVLHRPRIPENIGSAARAMRNMGLTRLRVVAPENWDLERIQTLATHVATDVVAGIAVFPELTSALTSFSYVVGTTARQGGQREATRQPARLAQQLIAISQENPIAIVFGPEDRGLTNEDLRHCHSLVTIPTAEFASLNLAQAVMVICYELFLASQPEPAPFIPRLASRHELDGMYAQLRDVLVRISYIQPDNPDYWMHHMRQFLTRYQLRAREVKMIRGLCRQINWFGKKCFQDGAASMTSTAKPVCPTSAD